jgi:hypothetical protein
MKNFLDLLDIDPTIDIFLKLCPIGIGGDPEVVVLIDGQMLHAGVVSQDWEVTVSHKLIEPISISISLANKRYQLEKETAVLIETLQIDGHDMIPGFTHYAHYVNDHDRAVIGSYLGWNGTWTFETQKPFYQWLHQATGQGWLLEPI